MKWAALIVLLLAIAGVVWYVSGAPALEGPSVVRDESGVRIPLPEVSVPLRTLNGTVIAVEGRVVRVAVNLLPGTGIDDSEWIREREVVVGDDTKVFLREARTEEEYQAAVAEFNRVGEGMYPERYVDMEVAPGDLKVGQTVGIEAFENVLNEERFEAMTIRGL